MAITTNRNLKYGNLAHQEAIVKSAQRPHRRVKHIIPGGVNMLSYMDPQDTKIWEKAIYNWLRRVNGFSEVTISFAKELESIDTYRECVHTFAEGDKHPWIANKFGRQFLAEKLAEIVTAQKCVALEVNSEGIFVLSNSEFGPYTQDDEGGRIPTEAWEPYIEFLADGRNEYAQSK